MAHIRFDRGPAAEFVHDHPPVRDVNVEEQEQLTRGQRIADRVASVVGSWPFILVQTGILSVWILANVYLTRHYRDRAFDPFPFILLNLVLSFQAAYTGPVVMMSQNRQSQKDRLVAENDFQVNRTAEQEIKVLMDHLAHQDVALREILERLSGIEETLTRGDGHAGARACEHIQREARPHGLLQSPEGEGNP